MDKIIINGQKSLSGEVNISTAKNAVLPIMVASILTDDEVIINKAPMLEDVYVLGRILRSLNVDVIIDKETGKILIDNNYNMGIEANGNLVRKMRASSLLMGPILAKKGRFRISLPGGCNIGTRPIDLHLKGLTALGADINIGHGYVEARTKGLIGSKIYLDYPSVGATENIMMASVLAKGDTIIENAAEEPEIEDLANFLIAMGAKIYGAGTDRIIVSGVNYLKGVEYTPIYDRIEAGTFMIAAAITHSKIKINGIKESNLKPVIAKLAEAGVMMEIEGENIIVDGSDTLLPVDIKTLPYPGFPTDMQSQMMSLLSTIKGTSIITETIFENRFMCVSELKRMGSNIKIEGRTATIQGVENLTGAEVRATDLRAGAALILAALAAKGESVISGVKHIDRGYVEIEKKLKGLGAAIRREMES